VLISPLDKFHADMAEIRGVSIIEEITQREGMEIMRYRLKFTLQDGKKTAVFASTSYNKLEEIANLIMRNLAEKT